jgi:hypothetical protein
MVRDDERGVIGLEFGKKKYINYFLFELSRATSRPQLKLGSFNYRARLARVISARARAFLCSPMRPYSPDGVFHALTGPLILGLQNDSKISDFIRDPIQKIIKIIRSVSVSEEICICIRKNLTDIYTIWLLSIRYLHFR